MQSPPEMGIRSRKTQQGIQNQNGWDDLLQWHAHMSGVVYVFALFFPIL